MVASSYTGPHTDAGPSAPSILVSAPRRVSWGAIIAGVVIALAIQFLLSVLGLGIGLTTVNPATGTTPAPSSLGIGAAVWWGITYLIALFAGGYVAARLAASWPRLDGVLHGVLTWSIALLVMLYLLSTAVGSMIGGAFNVIGGTLSASGQALKETAPQMAQAAGITPDTLQQKAKDLLSAQGSGSDPKSLTAEQAQQEIAANLPKLAAGGDQAQQARGRITAIIAAQLNISPDEANQRLDRLQSQAAQTLEQAGQSAKQATGSAASGLSKASITAFVALLLGAVIAGCGGYLGARQRERIAPA